MTSTVSVPVDLAQAARDALVAQGDEVSAAKLDRVLNPPNVWVIRGPEDADGYGSYLGRSIFDMNHGAYSDDPDACPWEFTTANNAHLFTDEQKAAFDGQAILDAYITDDHPTQPALDVDADYISECLVDEVVWELAPTEADGAAAFASGNTELDFCEALIALGARADRMRSA